MKIEDLLKAKQTLQENSGGQDAIFVCPHLRTLGDASDTFYGIRLCESCADIIKKEIIKRELGKP